MNQVQMNNEKVSDHVDNRDSSSSETHIFIAERGDGCIGIELLSDESLQDTGACAMKDSQSAGVKLDGIIKEIYNGLYCFISSHTPHINLGFKIELTFAGGRRRLT